MKHLIVLLFSLIVLSAVGCRFRTVSPGVRTFKVPSHRSRNHWGAPGRTSVRSRYWGQHRYGPKPHPNRGRYR